MKGKFLPFSVLSRWQLTPSRKLRCQLIKGSRNQGIAYLPSFCNNGKINLCSDWDLLLH